MRALLGRTDALDPTAVATEEGITLIGTGVATDVEVAQQVQEEKGVDDARTVLRVLCGGAAVALCRERGARKLECAGKSGAGYRVPLMYACMPKGWRKRTRGGHHSGRKEARVWFFGCNKDGEVEVERSKGLTLGDAVDHIFTHLHGSA